MFGTTQLGAGGYGTQPLGPQGFYGNVLGQFGQPTGMGIGQLQLGGLPLMTIGPGAVPFQQTQPQFGQPQFGQPQFGQPQFGQPQVGAQVLGQRQAPFIVTPVVTPQGWVGLLLLSTAQPVGIGLGPGMGTQQFAGGIPGGLGQFPQQIAPWITGAYGYGLPQLGSQGVLGGAPAGFGGGVGGGALAGQIGGGPGAIGGGYPPFQPQQQFGASPWFGQPLGALPIH